jgi:cytochrome c-type biogenesis protein CcmH
MNWLALILLLMPGLAWAGEAKPLMEDPVAEARLKHLAVELRCLVCQNQTLADSNAPLAEDLRREVREMIAKNMSDQEIIDFLVSRYGDFVLYRPPLKATTTLLWVGPFVLMIGGAIALVTAMKRRGRKLAESVVASDVTEEEHRRVEQLLSQGEKRA